MKKRQWIISSVLTLFILMLGALGFQKLKSQKKSTVSDKKEIKQELRTVKVNSFSPAKIQSKIAIDGKLNAYEKVDLFAEVTGRLIRNDKAYKEGTYFKKGDLLFQVEDKDDLYNLYAQRSLLMNAITQIMPDLKFDYPNSFEKWKNYLREFNVEQTVKELPEVFDEKEKFYVAGKNIYNLYYTIKSMEDRMSNYRIYAPFNGVFLSVNKYPGSLVSPGQSLGRIMNSDQNELLATVSMSDLKYVKTGQKVELTSEELGKSWKGSVSRIGRQIDQSTQSIPLFVNVQGAGLKDGIFLSGTLNGNYLTEVSSLPKNIILNDNNVFVYQDSILSLHDLEVVSIEENNILVKGLAADQKVVVSSINNLYDGQKVILEN